MNTLCSLAVLITYSLAIKIELDHIISYNDFNNQWSKTLQLLPYRIPTLSVCLGEPHQCFNLAPALTSGLTIVENTAAYPKIFPHSYNISLSQTHVNLYHHLKFGSLNNNLSGKLAKELITISNTTITALFTFLIADVFRDGIELPIDGFLGLQKYYSDETVFYHPENSFVKFLYDTRTITMKTFALSYSDKRSYIEFGQSYPQHRACLSPLSNYDNNKWDCNLTEVVIGEKRVKTDHHVVSFDSTSKTINVPSPFKDIIFNDVLNKVSPGKCKMICESQRILFHCEETIDVNRIPHLKVIMTNNVTLVIKWKEVFNRIEMNNETVLISSLIVDDFTNLKWRIGIPGMIDHTIIFDTRDNSIGIIPFQINEIQSITPNRTLYYAVSIVLIGGISLLLLIQLKANNNMKQCNAIIF